MNLGSKILEDTTWFLTPNSEIKPGKEANIFWSAVDFYTGKQDLGSPLGSSANFILLATINDDKHLYYVIPQSSIEQASGPTPFPSREQMSPVCHRFPHFGSWCPHLIPPGLFVIVLGDFLNQSSLKIQINMCLLGFLRFVFLKSFQRRAPIGYSDRTEDLVRMLLVTRPGRSSPTLHVHRNEPQEAHWSIFAITLKLEARGHLWLLFCLRNSCNYERYYCISFVFWPHFALLTEP